MEQSEISQPSSQQQWGLRFYLFAKKTHRLLVVVIVFVTLIMAGTGTVLKYPELAKYLFKLDLNWVRYLHNELSPIFTTILILMMLSGLIMYWYPWHTRRSAKLNK
ncbi:MAG: hypothetical protein HY973_02935 [Candidatus Kerfeldbacteria bacterium]|nr:hypothetical protein [Candidatus Kerfeldbacteria bacterium]